MMSIGMVAICIGVGFLCGFVLAAALGANTDDIETIRTDRIEGAKYFAMRLKEKVQKPEFPWEDFFICESDIDEVLKEMESENK